MFDAQNLKAESKAIYNNALKDIVECSEKLKIDLTLNGEVFNVADLSAAAVTLQLPVPVAKASTPKISKVLNKARSSNSYNQFQSLYAANMIVAKQDVNDGEKKADVEAKFKLSEVVQDEPTKLFDLIRAIEEMMDCLWKEHRLVCVLSYSSMETIIQENLTFANATISNCGLGDNSLTVNHNNNNAGQQSLNAQLLCYY
ncbi:hypothetical protein MBANPS3_012592 [Mucor bainieri]